MRRGWVAAIVLLLLGGCSSDGGVRPLAKIGQWRDASEVSFVRMEVAFDRATAERAWHDNVPDDLPVRDGRPAEPGRYGDLDDIDFDSQALVVWSAGESGSCPAWLSDVLTDRRGTIADTTEDTGGFLGGGGCSDAFSPYTMLLAVDRARLPEPGALPVELLEPDGTELGQLVTYPAG